MKYNKLVRDKVPQIISKKGNVPVTHIADEKEYWQKLKEKLREEVNEFIFNEKEDELADILEVMESIYAFKKMDSNTIMEIKNKKKEERGGFTKKIILDETKE